MSMKRNREKTLTTSIIGKIKEKEIIKKE